MKRNLFAACAVIVAIVFSSFSGKRTTEVYFVLKHNSLTNHSLRGNYNETLVAQFSFIGGAKLKWIMINDDNGTVSGPEFTTMYNALDFSVPQNTTLNDDPEGMVMAGGIVYQLEKHGF